MSLHGGPSAHVVIVLIVGHFVDHVVLDVRLVVHVDDVPREPRPALLVDRVLVLRVLSPLALIQLRADVFCDSHATENKIFSIFPSSNTITFNLI